MKHATRNNHNMSFINKKLLLIIINNKLNIKCLIQLLTSYDKKSINSLQHVQVLALPICPRQITINSFNSIKESSSSNLH